MTIGTGIPGENNFFFYPQFTSQITYALCNNDDSKKESDQRKGQRQRAERAKRGAPPLTFAGWIYFSGSFSSECPFMKKYIFICEQKSPSSNLLSPKTESIL